MRFSLSAREKQTRKERQGRGRRVKVRKRMRDNQCKNQTLDSTRWTPLDLPVFGEVFDVPWVPAKVALVKNGNSACPWPSMVCGRAACASTAECTVSLLGATARGDTAGFPYCALESHSAPRALAVCSSATSLLARAVDGGGDGET